MRDASYDGVYTLSNRHRRGQAQLMHLPKHKALHRKKCEARRYAGFCAPGLPRVWPPFLWAGGRPPGSVPPTRQLALRIHKESAMRRTASLQAGLLGVAARRDCPFHPPWLLVPSAFACGAAPKVTRLCCS